ncbi:MAG: hypothetical protein IPK60_00405 [Sandaracinaceae bacterium]|nr:hypothetical protein [Sandaracinaceae bacterium]
MRSNFVRFSTSKAALTLAACALTLVACGHRRALRTIPAQWVGTSYAQIVSYFDLGHGAQEASPPDIPHDVLRDEATLSELDDEHMCVDVVIRTASYEDEPIELLSPTCITGRRRTGAILMGGYVSVFDVVAAQSLPVNVVGTSSFVMPGQVVADHVPAQQFTTMQIAAASNAFRVIERGAHLCCANPGRRDVGLTLRNASMNNHRGATASYTWNVE